MDDERVLDDGRASLLVATHLERLEGIARAELSRDRRRLLLRLRPSRAANEANEQQGEHEGDPHHRDGAHSPHAGDRSRKWRAVVAIEYACAAPARLGRGGADRRSRLRGYP